MYTLLFVFAVAGNPMYLTLNEFDSIEECEMSKSRLAGYIDQDHSGEDYSLVCFAREYLL